MALQIKPRAAGLYAVLIILIFMLAFTAPRMSRERPARSVEGFGPPPGNYLDGSSGGPGSSWKGVLPASRGWGREKRGYGTWSDGKVVDPFGPSHDDAYPADRNATTGNATGGMLFTDNTQDDWPEPSADHFPFDQGRAIPFACA